jgi:hypothetical protein
MLKYDHLKGKELYKFLVDNKKALINEKKSLPVKFADSFIHSTKLQFKTKSGAFKDAMSTDTEDPTDTDILRVEVIANTCMWMDSQSDVLLIDSSKRTIKNNKDMMQHIHDHIYQISAKIGEVVNVELRTMAWKDLGVNIPGNTQVIVFITDVMKSYNEQIFNQYKAGKINQHSIGLRYVTLEMAINDPDYEKEIDFWNKYIDQIGNKQDAIDQGYFWIVPEIKLLENSCVLFGSNPLTPTLSTSGKNHSTNGTHKEDIGDDNEDAPPAEVTDSTTFDMGALLNIFSN